MRLPRIDTADIGLFEFDFDTTMAIFFLTAKEQVYGRYGGRDDKGPDTRMSLAGLHYAAEAALDAHSRLLKEPDLAISKFTRLIEDGLPIDKYGDGSTARDYTYIDDIVEGVVGALHLRTGPLCEILNLGGSQTVTLNELITTIEAAVGKPARINALPDQPGDVPLTSADVSKAARLLGFQPHTRIGEGVARYVEWFRQMRRDGVVVC